MPSSKNTVSEHPPLTQSISQVWIPLSSQWFTETKKAYSVVASVERLCPTITATTCESMCKPTSRGPRIHFFLNLLFTDRVVLEEYIEKNSQTGMFICRSCGKENKNKTNLKNHIESIHFPGQFVYYCRVCNNAFNGKNSLSVHMSVAHKNAK